MNVVRWDPFSNMDTLFNRMLPKAFAGWPRLGPESNGDFQWSPSADISETTRNGPHWSSTWAMTASVRMSVTSPTNRLRAELARPSGRGGGAAWVRATRASSWPSTTFRPDSSTLADRVPASIQRRRVSSLTPR